MSYPPTKRRLGPVARERVAGKLRTALEAEGELTAVQLRETLSNGGKRVVQRDVDAALAVLEQRGQCERVAGSGSSASWRATS